PTALTLNEAQVSIVLAAVSGGMYEIGDDLPTLGSSPERLALVENPDLLQMAKLGHAGVPLDLLTYRPEDEQPSVMFLREDKRQSMLAVFNWTDRPRSHTFDVAGLNLPSEHSYQLTDVLNPNQSVVLHGGSLRLDNQPARSVRLIKIVDTSIDAAAPSVTAHVPDRAKIGESIKFFSQATADGVPAVGYQWDFGDGIVADGAAVTHAYTYGGTFSVKLKADGVDGIPAEKKFSIVVSGETKMSPPRRYTEPSTKSSSEK
ncbi:MAG: PKD domain-containing protein, partial [Blastocatellia bacterium]